MTKSVLKNIIDEVAISLKGGERDYTSGSLKKAVLYLSIPMVLEMALESVFSVVDAFFVGKLGSDVLAAVGITDALITIVFAVGMGLSMGATALVARRIGEKEKKQAGIAAVQSIWLGIFVAFPISIIGVIFPRELLSFMGASESVIEVGWGFTAVLMGGNVTILLLFILNAVFRGAGDAAIAMRVLWISNAINIVLDPLLIFGIGPFPEMGVAGAAVATTIGRGTGVIIQLFVLFGKKGRINLSFADLNINPKVMWGLLKVSTGGVLQSIIATASWVGLVRILALFGSAALAGYTIAIRIIIFTILPSWGMSNAAATLVGQNLGAKKPERAEKSVWISCYSNLVFLGIVAIIFIIIPEPLIRIFTSDPETLRIGSEALRIVSYGYGFYAFGMVMEQAFNGAGDTMTPTKINLFAYWLFQIPIALLLSLVLEMGANGVFWAIMLGETVLTIVSVILFKRGKWKEKEV